ncbi:MAG: biopolymer transporter ExbD [Candidatus Omnitrophica bacterium]|nr:biopolymer transporter ExbD [Candidatus Omnitrophota bacterium]
MEFERGKRIRMHLDIAPLIDIVFLLLIFFMLTANFIMQPGIKLALPQAATAKPQEEENIIVFITKDNRIYLNDREINIDELRDALEEKLKTARKKTVVLKADERINLGLAVRVMDVAKEAGTEGLVISTQIKDKLQQDRNVNSVTSATELNK